LLLVVVPTAATTTTTTTTATTEGTKDHAAPLLWNSNGGGKSGERTPRNNKDIRETQEQQEQDTTTDDWLYEETMDHFVSNPAATDVSGTVMPIKLSFWTTPHRDWDNMVLDQLKAIVLRFSETTTSSNDNSNHHHNYNGGGLLQFHPHQALLDGSSDAVGCRQPAWEEEDHQQNEIPELSEECLTDCINAGRYCVVPMDDDEDHEGLTGADIVLESARRLCIWIVYGQQFETMVKYWNYVDTLRNTNCDRSLTDACLDRVYREVGIEDNEMQNCLHNAGGVGIQVDNKNALLSEETHRSAHFLTDTANATTDTILPQLSINGMMVANSTTLSDYDLLIHICNAFAAPKPKLCDFCLQECPIGNPNHDPTRQCLWDLTCGDERTFDDWVNGEGVFAPGYQHNNNTIGNHNATNNNNGDGTTEEEKEEAAGGDVDSNKDENNPDNNQEGDDVDSSENDEDDDEEDLSTAANSTTTSSNDTAVPPPHHDHDNKNETEQHSTPAPAPTSHYGTKPTQAPHHHGSSGGVLAGHKSGAQLKPANTTDPSKAIGGILLAIVCLSAVVVSIVAYHKWRSQRAVYAHVIGMAAEQRDPNGLASTASHAAACDNDLTLHVELGQRRKSSSSSGYAPPASAAGTWG
jgi:hypothetical protein